MFRITPYIIRTRTLLLRRRPIDLQLAAISRSLPYYKFKKAHEPEREPCPHPKQICPPPKNDSLFWGAMAVVVVAGAFAVYAKRSPEVRDWLTIHASWFDDLIAVAYQENMTYGELAEDCAIRLKNYITSLFEDTPKKCLDDGTPIIVEQIAQIEETPESPDEDDEDVVESPCDSLPPPVATKDICEIEACLKDLGDEVVHNYYSARQICLYYNQLVQNTMVKFSFPGLKALRPAMEERLRLVAESVENAEIANAQLDDLSRYLVCGVCEPKEKIESTKILLKDYQDKIVTVRTEFEWQNDKSLVLDVQWQKVEVILDKYIEENESQYGDMHYLTKKPALKGDLDFLLYHTLRYCKVFKADLEEGLQAMIERSGRAVTDLPQGTEAEMKLRKSLINSTYSRRRGELDKEYSNRTSELYADNDKQLKDALRKQKEEFELHMKRTLRKKTEKFTAKFNQMVEEKVASEKKLFAKQLAEMATKLKALEDELNSRLKLEREKKRSQDLWAAGASLLAATKKGEPFVKVERELRAIEKASDGKDKLVLTVLHAIPDSVWEEGVVPESILREKYYTMEQVALKVALVEHDGAPLPIYLVSWLQAAMLFMKVTAIPQTELDNPPEEPFKYYDTFDLLQRARYWIRRGNIAAALKYVSYLEGASRIAAATWADAARSHLETRQAAEAVLAHAAAMGLQYI